MVIDGSRYTIKISEEPDCPGSGAPISALDPKNSAVDIPVGPTEEVAEKLPNSNPKIMKDKGSFDLPENNLHGSRNTLDNSRSPACKIAATNQHSGSGRLVVGHVPQDVRILKRADRDESVNSVSNLGSGSFVNPTPLLDLGAPSTHFVDLGPLVEGPSNSLDLNRPVEASPPTLSNRFSILGQRKKSGSSKSGASKNPSTSEDVPRPHPKIPLPNLGQSSPQILAKLSTNHKWIPLSPLRPITVLKKGKKL